MFENFTGYINYFLLNDLLDENNNINFYLPFDNFKTRPIFSSVNQYLLYKENVIDFIKLRNKRIENYIELNTKHNKNEETQ